MLYSKQPDYFNKTAIDRRINKGSGGGNAARKANDAKDLNIDERIIKFQNQLKNFFVNRIPLRDFRDLRKSNFPLKIGFKIKWHIEIDSKKRFKSKNLYVLTDTIPSAPDAKVIFTKSPFIQYE